ncbi:MAG: EscU/YscU/HrcU family type III secretion system export apparatus switch protein [Kofleriaceae bacterium]|nr:EscU/YscU/HrcU family type III secretion system export apparatus switch protein [Kofleriaceae bacterium]
MSQEDKSQKTQKPTPKRIQDFRKEGKIAMSKDLTFVMMMLLGGGMGMALADGPKLAVSNLMRMGLSSSPDADGNIVFQAGVSTLFTSCWPVMVGALLGVFLTTGMQLGWPPAFKKIQFKPGKVFAMSGLKELVSLKSAGGRVLKATAKSGLVMFVLALVIRAEYNDFLESPAMESLAIGDAVFGAVGRLGLYSIMVLGALAIIDFGFQKKKIMADMMMSMEDIKNEHKKQEGDPLMKGKRKQRMRELSSRRLQSEVQGADVVIVNPTHYSVALKYDSEGGGAPRVVAKGKDEIAAKIREFARKAGVPIVPRPPLTRLVYRLVPEGGEIPADLYQAVAEILAYVYKLRPHRSIG